MTKIFEEFGPEHATQEAATIITHHIEELRRVGNLYGIEFEIRAKVQATEDTIGTIISLIGKENVSTKG